MIFEHFALNVAEPHKMKEWYVEHVGFHVVSEMEESPFMIFLADHTGRVVLELYRNEAGAILDYPDLHHLTIHLALESADSASDSEQLISAGCSLVEEINKDDGSKLIMLRDPWGLALQICQRGERMNEVALS